MKGIYEWRVETRNAEGFHHSYWDSEEEAHDVAFNEACSPANIDVIIHRRNEETVNWVVHEVLK